MLDVQTVISEAVAMVTPKQAVTTSLTTLEQAGGVRLLSKDYEILNKLFSKMVSPKWLKSFTKSYDIARVTPQDIRMFDSCGYDRADILTAFERTGIAKVNHDRDLIQFTQLGVLFVSSILTSLQKTQDALEVEFRRYDLPKIKPTRGQLYLIVQTKQGYTAIVCNGVTKNGSESILGTFKEYKDASDKLLSYMRADNNITLAYKIPRLPTVVEYARLSNYVKTPTIVKVLAYMKANNLTELDTSKTVPAGTVGTATFLTTYNQLKRLYIDG